MIDILVMSSCRYVGDKQGSFLVNTLTKIDGGEEENEADDRMFGTLYKTGDFARIVNGRLYYEGRLDAQVHCWLRQELFLMPCQCHFCGYINVC